MKNGWIDGSKRGRKEGIRSMKMTVEYKKTNLGIPTDMYFSRI